MPFVLTVWNLAGMVWETTWRATAIPKTRSQQLTSGMDTPLRQPDCWRNIVPSVAGLWMNCPFSYWSGLGEYPLGMEQMALLDMGEDWSYSCPKKENAHITEGGIKLGNGVNRKILWEGSWSFGDWSELGSVLRRKINVLLNHFTGMDSLLARDPIRKYNCENLAKPEQNQQNKLSSKTTNWQ